MRNHWCPGTRSRCYDVRSPGRSRIGLPGGPGGAGPAAHGDATAPPARHARDPAGLVPPPDHMQVDVSEPARPPGNQQGDPRAGAAAGAGEPGLGVPQPKCSSQPTTRQSSAAQTAITIAPGHRRPLRQDPAQNPRLAGTDLRRQRQQHHSAGTPTAHQPPRPPTQRLTPSSCQGRHQNHLQRPAKNALCTSRAAQPGHSPR